MTSRNNPQAAMPAAIRPAGGIQVVEAALRRRCSRAAPSSAARIAALVLCCSLTALLGLDCGGPQVSQPIAPPPPTITACGLIGSSCGGNSGALPSSVALADLDNDRDLDIAIANFGFNTISFLANDGTGTFTPGLDIVVGDHPTSIVAGDFDHNGHVDLAVTGTSGLVGPAVYVLLGQGGASFATPIIYGIGGVATFLGTADLNGDGFLDLFTANWPSNNISVLLNNGAGAFGAAANHAVSGGPRAIAALDLTKDGRPELAVTSESFNNAMIFGNDGAGAFLQAFGAPVGPRPYGIASGDLDLDGDADLVAANQGTTDASGGTISSLFDNGNSTLSAARTFTTGISPKGIVLADLDNDGDIDAATANFGIDAASSSVTVLLNTGGGNFAPAAGYAAGHGPLALAVGDLNADGLLDIVVANELSNTISFVVNVGNGQFQSVGAGP